MPTPIPSEYRQELEDCFRSMSAPVYRYLYRLTLRDEQLSEDMVQETFRKAAQNWHQLRGLTEEQRLAWLITAASNTATDCFRREEIARKMRPLIRERYMPTDADVYRRAITSIAVERFIEVINTMPLVRRRVALLFWRYEWRNQEIARELGITPGRVSQHIRAARETLREELGSYVPFEPSEPEGGARQ